MLCASMTLSPFIHFIDLAPSHFPKGAFEHFWQSVFPAVDSFRRVRSSGTTPISVLSEQSEYEDIVNDLWEFQFCKTLMLGYDWILITSTWLQPQCRALVVFKVLQLLEQTQKLLSFSREMESMRYKHTVVSWDQLLTIRRRESSKDLESSRLFKEATCGKTAAFRDE